MRALHFGVWCLMCTNVGWAGYGHGDGQPSQQILRAIGDGDWELYGQVSKPVFETFYNTVAVKVPVTVTVRVQENGQAVEKPVTEYKTVEKQVPYAKMRLVCEQFVRKVNSEAIEAYETDGRKIAPAALKQRVRGNTLVVVVRDALPEYYAAVFKPGTVVLIAPAVQPAAPLPASVRPQAQLPLPVRLAAFQPPAIEAPVEMPQFPATPEPIIAFAGRDGADAIKIRRFRETKMFTDITVRVGDSAVAPEKLLKTEHITRHSETCSVPWTAVRVSQLEGADVATNRVQERLGTGETAVLLSADGKLVDAFWLQNIKPNVLVIRGVQFPMGHHGYAAPAAYPAPVPVDVGPAPAAPPPPGAAPPST